MDSGYNYGGSFGGGGGGFTPGETTSPAGGKSDSNNSTLRPITIKQALDATQPYPDASYQVDGADISSVVIVGQVRNISTQSTNITYRLDDGTGEIEVKSWVDPSATDSMDTTGDDDNNDDATKSKRKRKHDQVQINGYAKVFGRLKQFFGDKRNINAHCVRPVKDINEVNCHLLEATAVHLFFTRGPPGGGGGSGGAAAGSGGDAAMGGVDDHAQSTMSPIAKRMYNLLKTELQTNEGLHSQFIAEKLKVPVADVTKAADELLALNVIFPTVDDYTWAVLEY